VGKGTLVILPPPLLSTSSYHLSMINLERVALRYYERSQRHIATGDAPDWLSDRLVPEARNIDDQIAKLTAEKAEYDQLAYVLYGTGTELEDSVALLLGQFGLKLYRQPKGANIDWKATHPGLKLNFAIEVTGTKGTIGKDSTKVGQAWEYIKESSGTPEENDRLVIVANTELHLEPGLRKKDSFTRDVVNLLDGGRVLMITTVQLYELWKMVHKGSRPAEDVVEELHRKTGLYNTT